jgi:PST family polysaccharide transporter
MVTVGAQGAKFILQMGSMAVLARLLSPGDFGLVAMLMAIIGLVGVFKDGGLSMATVQRTHITDDSVSSLFWINVLLGGVLTLLTIGVSPAIAWFYDESRLNGLGNAVAFTFLIGSLGTQHGALLRRQMRFVTISSVELVALTGSITVGICAALGDLGPWSLVLMALASSIIATSGNWVCTRWRPSKPRFSAHAVPMLQYGAGLSGAKFFNYAREQVPLILIGSSTGPGPLALYERAYRLLLMPISQMMPPLGAVALPTLARLQSETNRFRRTACRLISVATLLTLPISLVAFVAAEAVVELVLGAQWRHTADLFRWLAPLAATQGIATVGLWVLTTTGHSGVIFRLSLGNASIAVVSVAAGLMFGLEVAAASFALTGVLLRTPMLLYAVVRHTPINWGDLARPSVPAFSLALALAVLGRVAGDAAGTEVTQSAGWLAGTVSTVGAAWLALVLITGEFRTLRDLVIRRKAE